MSYETLSDFCDFSFFWQCGAQEVKQQKRESVASKTPVSSLQLKPGGI